MTFEEKARDQLRTPYDVVMTMVESLRNPVTQIDMDSYGYINERVCFGCAATNAICKIGGYDIVDIFGAKSDPVWDEGFGKQIHPLSRVDLTSTEKDDWANPFVWTFERAINALRKGMIWEYNIQAAEIGLPEIETPEWWASSRTWLSNDNYKTNLKFYVRLAMEQEGAPTQDEVATKLVDELMTSE